MERDTKVAVIGGGIAGCSVAYHLTTLGWHDITLLERHELTSGTTWHAAGLCTQFTPSYNLMTLLRRSVDLYSSLGDELKQPLDYHRCGSLRLATTEDRLEEFHHVKGVADLVGVPFDLVSASETKELCSLIDPAGLLASAYLPTDGWADPASVANALAHGARQGGAEIVRHTPVTGLSPCHRGWSVETPNGTLRAEIVVNAAGIWAREIAQMVGLDLPIVPFEHQYVMTEDLAAVAGLDRELPVVRDPDHSFYVRQDGSGLLVGPFERAPQPWSLDGVPSRFHNKLLRPNIKRITPILDTVAERIPIFEDSGLKKVLNGPDGYTPDGRALMGPVPGVRNFHVLAGFSIFGIVFGGGAGRYAAEWIAEGQPSDNMWELDVRRFGDYATSTQYVVERASDVYGREYAIRFPGEERPTGRPLKTSPLYDVLRARGAVYGARFGWERPLWFAKEEPAEDRYSFRRGNWHDAVGRECRSVASAAGVLDQTSFAKFEVSGPGAEDALAFLCANALPAGIGKIALTQMCTRRGGIECDVTVTRLTDDRFYIVSAAATEAHDLAWISLHLPADGRVTLENVSSRYGVLTLAGPRTRELLEAITGLDQSNDVFPFFSCRELEVGMAPVRAMRISFVGELGYELHHPIEYQRQLYELIRRVGEDVGLVDFGYRALESMRLEKAYRLWGADMSADYTPIEAGLERFVRFDSGEFIGRDTLLRQREDGVRQKLACLAVETDGADAHGYEPVADGDGPIGYVASGGFGHRTGKSIAMAYLPVAYTQPETELSIRILGEERRATVVAQPIYDPENSRLLS